MRHTLLRATNGRPYGGGAIFTSIIGRAGACSRGLCKIHCQKRRQQATALHVGETCGLPRANTVRPYRCTNKTSLLLREKGDHANGAKRSVSWWMRSCPALRTPHPSFAKARATFPHWGRQNLICALFFGRPMVAPTVGIMMIGCRDNKTQRNTRLRVVFIQASKCPRRSPRYILRLRSSIPRGCRSHKARLWSRCRAPSRQARRAHGRLP